MRKIRTPDKVSITNRILRALGRQSAFEIYPPSKEEKYTDSSIYYAHCDVHKQLTNAMLETERMKAECVREHQRLNRHC